MHLKTFVLPLFFWISLLTHSLSFTLEEIDFKGPFTVLIDASIENESSVESVVDGFAIDDSDTLTSMNFYGDKEFQVNLWDQVNIIPSFSYFSLAYDEYSQNDFTYMSSELTLEKSLDNDVTVESSLAFESGELDNQDLFDAIAFKFNLHQTLSGLPVRYQYRISDQNYEDRFNPDRSGFSHRLEIRLSNTILENLPVQWTGRLEHKSADDNGFAYYGIEGKMEISRSLFMEALEFTLGLGLRSRSYLDDYPGYEDERDDTRFTITLETEHPLYKDILSLSFELQHETNNSNINDFDFNNTTFGVHLILLWV